MKGFCWITISQHMFEILIKHTQIIIFQKQWES